MLFYIKLNIRSMMLGGERMLVNHVREILLVRHVVMHFGVVD